MDEKKIALIGTFALASSPVIIVLAALFIWPV